MLAARHLQSVFLAVGLALYLAQVAQAHLDRTVPATNHLLQIFVRKHPVLTSKPMQLAKPDTIHEMFLAMSCSTGMKHWHGAACMLTGTIVFACA